MLVGTRSEIDIVSEFFDQHSCDVPVPVYKSVEIGFEQTKDVKVEVPDDFELAFLRFSSGEIDAEMYLKKELSICRRKIKPFRDSPSRFPQ